jgi:hypothetical protein
MLQCYVLTFGRSVTAFSAPPRSQRPGQMPRSPHPKAGPADVLTKVSEQFSLNVVYVAYHWWPPQHYYIQVYNYISIYFMYVCIFLHGSIALVGQGLLGDVRSTDTRHSACSTLFDDWSTRRRDVNLTTHSAHKGRTGMPPAEFEPTIPEGEQPQTHTLDRAATGIGHIIITIIIYLVSTSENCEARKHLKWVGYPAPLAVLTAVSWNS